MATINDVEFTALAGRGFNTGTINDRRRGYWAGLSGLPLSSTSVADHMHDALPGVGAIQDRELAWMKGLGAVGTTYNDVRYDFYTRSLLP